MLLTNKTKVVDEWWPWRFGTVIKSTKRTTHVRWLGGDVWKYDRTHMKFLKRHKL